MEEKNFLEYSMDDILFSQLPEEMFSDVSYDPSRAVNIDDVEPEVPEFKRDFRFGNPISQNEVNQCKVSRIPVKTGAQTNWSVRVWNDWRMSRNFLEGREFIDTEHYHYVPKLHGELTSHELNFWLCRFVLEVRRMDRNPYPPLTLTNLCAGIYRYLREECNRPDFNFMDKSNVHFFEFQAVLDGEMKRLHRAGIGVTKKQAKSVCSEEEEKLWVHVFSKAKTDSLCLSYAVYFYSCKMFALRSCDEHRQFNAEDLEFGVDSVGEFVKFRGKTCKNNQGGRKVNPFKEILQYADSTNPRCVVQLFKFYLQHIPETGPFYRRPIKGIMHFTAQVIGKNTLSQYMKQMCAVAKLDGQFSGHSGKATAATVLYQHGVDEQLIKERTFHRSDAVRQYKRTSSKQTAPFSFAVIFRSCSDEIFLKSVKELSALAWTDQFYYIRVNVADLHLMQNILRDKGDAFVENSRQFVLLEPEDADFKNFIPKGHHLSPLGEEHRKILLEGWPFIHYLDLNEEIAKETIQHFPTIGLFDDSTGKLLSFTVEYRIGMVGGTYTDVSVRSKGYAKLVSKALSSLVYKEGRYPLAVVDATNLRSIGLYSSLPNRNWPAYGIRFRPFNGENHAWFGTPIDWGK